MLQKLLADRFKLVTHRITKELHGYALVVARNGPKIKTATELKEAPPLPEYMKGGDSSPLRRPDFAFERGQGYGRGYWTWGFPVTISRYALRNAGHFCSRQDRDDRKLLFRLQIPQG